MFKLYSCKVRLQGSVLNEVPKSDVTAPEIEVLRALHGSDAVAGIVETGSVKRSDRDERRRLEEVYADAGSVGEAVTRKKRMLTDLFGHERMALPKEIDAAPAVEEDDDDAETEQAAPAAPIRRTRAKPAEATDFTA